MQRLSRGTVVRWLGLFLGPALALLTALTLPSHYETAAGAVPLTAAGKASAALAVWMAVWWLTQAIHVSSTALLPLVYLPLAGAATFKEAAAPYASPLIFLFLGGFVISLSMQRWGLHRRIAVGTLRVIGERPDRVVAGFLAVSAFLSMWVSNTATAVMMLPIAVSVLGKSAPAEGSEGDSDRNFSAALLLAVAYGCSIGGIATLIGTPPNLFLASYARQNLGETISFARWMLVGVPVMLLLLPLTFVLLTRVAFPLSRAAGARTGGLEQEHPLGPMSRGEKATLAVFVMAVALWLLQPVVAKVQVFRDLTDPTIAMLAAMALFVIPISRKGPEFVMRWEDAAKLPWGILILFGGGLSLSHALDTHGVGAFLGNQVEALRGIPPFLLVIAVTVLILALTELTSNTAAAATFIPILAGVAKGLEVSPWVLIVPATLAASCAFVLPVATPPNAVIFGSGRVTMQQMIRGGIWINLASAVVIPLVTWFIARPLFER